MCQGIAQGRGQENRRLYDRQSRLTVQRDDLSWAKASETEGLSLRKHTTNLILWIICLILIFLTVVPLLLGYYMGPRITRQILKQEVESLLQKKIEIGSSGFTIFGGFGIEYRNVRIPGPDGKEFFRAKAFLLKPWIQSLLLGRLRWKSIVLKNPSVHLIRTSGGHINFGWKPREKTQREERGFFDWLQGMTTLLPSQLSIRGGKVRFTDFGLTQDPVVSELEEIQVTSQSISQKKPFSFHLTGRFTGHPEEKFSISSKINGIGEPLDSTRLEFQISLETEGIDSLRIWPYVRPVVPFEKMQGLLDLQINCTGRPTSFQSSGEIGVRNARFALPTLFTGPIEPKEASFKYDLQYENKEIQIPRMVIRVPHLSVRGSGSIQRIHSSDRSISFDLATGRTPLRDIRPYLPDRLVPKNVLSLLSDPGIQGSLRVERARLDGPWAALTPEGLRKNPEMLSLRVRLDKGSFLIDSKLPPFRSISGVLTIRGDQARIKGFHGRFLRSQLLGLNGSISQIYSDPVMALSLKGDLDLKGLLPLRRANRMPEEFRKILARTEKISGKARMTGKMRYAFNRVTDITYNGRITLRDIRVKMAGFPLPLTDGEGEIQYNEKEITLSQLKWKMGKSLCNGSASFHGYLRRLRGKLALSEKMRISLDMGAESIGIGDSLSNGKSKQKLRFHPKSIWVNSAIDGKLRISKGSFKGSRFEDFQTSFLVKQGLLRFKSFKAAAPGGFLRCRGWINLKSRRGVSFKLIPEIHGLDMTNVVRTFLAQERAILISGALNLGGIITGGADSMDGITRSLRGDLWFRVADGSIGPIQTGKVKRLPYNHATGQIMIRNGVASTKDLYMDSDAISMAIKGQADLNSQTLNVSIGVRPLQTMDKILSNVPVAGWLLAGKDGSILTFSYRVRGKFDDLKVESGSTQNRESMNP